MTSQKLMGQKHSMKTTRYDDKGTGRQRTSNRGQGPHHGGRRGRAAEVLAAHGSALLFLRAAVITWKCAAERGPMNHGHDTQLQRGHPHSSVPGQTPHPGTVTGNGCIWQTHFTPGSRCLSWTSPSKKGLLDARVSQAQSGADGARTVG